MAKEIGFVSSTVSAPANENRFTFIIKKTEENKESFILNQFDLVKIERTLIDIAPIFAIVESISSFCDAPDHVANFVSSNFGQAPSGSIDRIAFYSVTARVLLNEDGVYFPVKTGDKVYTCDEEDAYKALYADYCQKKNDYFPIALQTMYKGNKEKIDLCTLLNETFLLGPDAAHLNVSGMSGMASKTTKVMTILRELFYHSQSLSIIIFNTKDKDLLSIKEDNHALDTDIYTSLTSQHKNTINWNKSITILRPNDNSSKVTKGRYTLDFDTQKNLEYLDLLVAMDDDSGTMDSCVKSAQTDSSITTWDNLKTTPLKINPLDTKSEPINSQTQNKFKRLLGRVITDKSTSLFTLKSSINTDITVLVEKYLKAGRVIVVDIAPLDSLQQAIVFGSVLRTAQAYRRRKDSKNKVALFIDEVNKYASYDTPNQAPILQNLIDIAETGRSIGLCLVTAEQSLSIIHRRIKANFSNMLFGKTGPLELSQPDYMMIPDSYKQRLTTFQHKDALVSTSNLNAGLIHAVFPDKFYKE